MKPRFALRWLAVAWIFATVTTLISATLTVVNKNDDGPGSLRQAIREAVAGDTIQVAVTGTITLSSGELWIGKSLILIGPGARLLTISGDRTQRVFHITG